MKKKFFIISALVTLIGLSCCAFMGTLSNKTPIKTMALTNLAFRGHTIKVLVPEEYGDFSLLGISEAGLISEEMVALIFVDTKSDRTFILFMKAKCPEPVGLIMTTNSGKNYHYWIYRDSEMPSIADEINFKDFMKKDHPCLIEWIPGTEV